MKKYLNKIATFKMFNVNSDYSTGAGFGRIKSRGI